MPSAWVTHVQGVYKKGKAKGMTYSQAMQKAKVSWAKKKKSNAAVAPAKKKAGKKKAKAEDDVEDEKAAEKPKRRKRAKKKVKMEEAVSEEPVRSRKGKSSAGSRRRIKAKDTVPKGIPGLGAPHKE
jgi:hypothetical protein